MNVRILASALGLASTLLLPAAAFAQAEAGIVGHVGDESKAMLPGATIVATDLGSGRQYTAVTDGSGEYRIRSLQPGTYKVQVELSGFATVSVPTMELLVGQNARLDFTLKLATVQETVTV